MKLFGVRFLMAGVFASAVATPAWADMTAEVQSKIDGALERAKSYVVTTHYPAQAYSATLVHVAPDRSRVVVAVAATTTDIVTLGDMTYSSKNGAPFEKAPRSAEPTAHAGPIGGVKVAALVADVTVDGVTYGAFDAAVPLGAQQTLRCTYDKKTFRLVRCANDDVTEIYGGYNDPANVIEAPSNVAAAPTVTK
jgi:hypothetical protein